jgi:uncharacterized protein YbcC (UPF0753/DUF2309 family)
MSTEHAIEDSIDDAAATVGSVWPIHSFVTANPLSGFEDVPFDEAVSQAADLLGGRGYPSPETFRAALDDGRIDPKPCWTVWTPASSRSARTPTPSGSTAC